MRGGVHIGDKCAQGTGGDRSSRRESGAYVSLLPPLTPSPSRLPPKVRDTQLRASGSGAPRCHFFSTFFLTKLLSMEAPLPKRGEYNYKEVGVG